MPETLRRHPVWSSLFGITSVFAAIMFVEDAYAWFAEKYHMHQPVFAFVAFVVILALVIVVIRMVSRHDSRDAALEKRVHSLEGGAKETNKALGDIKGLLGLVCDKLQVTRQEEKEATK